jgi:hypothetical protein
MNQPRRGRWTCPADHDCGWPLGPKGPIPVVPRPPTPTTVRSGAHRRAPSRSGVSVTIAPLRPGQPFPPWRSTRQPPRRRRLRLATGVVRCDSSAHRKRWRARRSRCRTRGREFGSLRAFPGWGSSGVSRDPGPYSDPSGRVIRHSARRATASRAGAAGSRTELPAGAARCAWRGERRRT